MASIASESGDNGFWVMRLLLSRQRGLLGSLGVGLVSILVAMLRPQR